MGKQENKKRASQGGREKYNIKDITSIIIVIILLIIAGITIPMLTKNNEGIEQKHLLTETIKKLSKTYTKPGTYKIIVEKPEWQEDGTANVKIQIIGDLPEGANPQYAIKGQENWQNYNNETDNIVTGIKHKQAIAIKVYNEKTKITKTNYIWIKKITVAVAKKEQIVFNQTETLEDDFENLVTIPKGFKVAQDSGTNIKEGIVIEDVSASEDVEVQGSQFVWIPIGNVKTSSNTEENIQLGRYTFNEETGEPTLVQSADNYLDDIDIINSVRGVYNSIQYVDVDGHFSEESEYREGDNQWGAGTNATVYDLKNFKENAQKYGGFYFARYESSYANGSSSSNYKCASKVSIATNNESGVRYLPGTLWDVVEQSEAAKTCINTYFNNSEVKSDLMNSYAWDTTIVYIQKMGNDNYANANGSASPELKNTGTTDDEKCHIYDMAGNLHEWSTESCTDCVLDGYGMRVSFRGGAYCKQYDKWNKVSSRSATYYPRYRESRFSHVYVCAIITIIDSIRKSFVSNFKHNSFKNAISYKIRNILY